MAGTWPIHGVDGCTMATQPPVNRGRRNRRSWAGLCTVAVGYSAQCSFDSPFFYNLLAKENEFGSFEIWHIIREQHCGVA